MDTPDCTWCDAATSLELVYSEMGVDFYRCSCCAKFTRVGRDEIAVRVNRRKTEPKADCHGNIIDGDY